MMSLLHEMLNGEDTCCMITNEFCKQYWMVLLFVITSIMIRQDR